MHKLLMTFLLIWTGTSVLAAIMAGGGGIVSTTLAANITADSENITVASTGLFASKDILVIGTEKTLYEDMDDTTFLGCERGYDDTTAAEHAEGTRVYTQEAGILNDVLGYNFVVEMETTGMYGIIMLPIQFFTTTLPHLIRLNVNFLAIPELAIIAIFWLVAGIGLLVTLAIEIGPIAVALVTGAFSALSGLLRR